jgi:hypothetical protein
MRCWGRAMNARDAVNWGRKLSTKELGRVRSRFIRASMRDAGAPEPSLREVRWSDDYLVVAISLESGLLACGFSMADRAVVHEHYVLFRRSQSAAASSLLGAIEEVINGGDYACSDARSFYDKQGKGDGTNS